jgi:hypothetical protein
VRRRRLVMNMPFWLAKIIASVLDFGSFVTGGLITNALLTRDQVDSLKSDNVVAEGAKTLADLGIGATGYASVIPEYLWRFRPSGQYEAITESAKHLKKV